MHEEARIQQEDVAGPKRPTKRTCVISLGINGAQAPNHPSVAFQDYARGLARIRDALLLHGYQGDIITWERDYPPGSPLTHQAPGAFKPLCFSEAQRRQYDIVLWLDSSIVVKRSIDPLLIDIERDGYLLFLEDETVGEYCKDAALVTLGITREESFTLPSCWSCVLGLDLSQPVPLEFLRQWKAFAEDGITFPGPKWSGVLGWPRTASQHPRVKGHRYDQTVASVIAAKLGMTKWRTRDDFSCFFDNDRSFVRQLNERFEARRPLPTTFSDVVDLGEYQIHHDQSNKAVGTFLRAIALAPTSPRGYHGLGLAWAQLSRWAEAMTAYKEALRHEPSHVKTHIALGDALRAIGDASTASSHYEQASVLDPDDPTAYRRLGQLHLARGAYGPALEALRRGLAFQPRDPEILTDLADVLLRSEAFAEAVETARLALNILPTHVRACKLLASGLELLGRRTEAIEAWLSLGVALESNDQLHEAAAVYRRLIARKSNCLRALNKLGWVCLKLARPEEGVASFEASLKLDPDNEQTHKRLGYAALMAGDELRGWQEWDWKGGLRGRHRFEQPVWDGSPLRGRTILVWADFALGDAILCLRYLAPLKNLGARVVVECHATMLPLVQRMPSVDQAVSKGAPLPSFDVHAPLFSLPATFYTQRLGGGLPYLTVSDELAASWRERLGLSSTNVAERVIGLAWAGSPTGSNARFRFTRLSSLAPLAELPGVRFVSLQLGPRAKDIDAPPPGLRIEAVLDDSCTAADTAAVMVNLDLVICIDSMVAHLAGALARPVWTVMWSSPAWWLWHVHGDRSLWYPSMRLFQQQRIGDWTEVFARVRVALELSTPAYVARGIDVSHASYQWPNGAAAGHTTSERSAK